MKHRGQASMRRELQDQVQATFDAESKKLCCIWVSNMSNDSELRQEISYSFLLAVLLDQPLHGHELAIG